MVRLQRDEIVEQLARALVVLLLVARGRRLVERLGEAIGVARHEVVVVASVVEAGLLVGDAPQRETREVAHREEAFVRKNRGGLILTLGVGDLAEEVLAFLQAASVDLHEPREIRRLRPEARGLRHLRIGGERAFGIAGRLLGLARDVRHLAADLRRRGRRHRLEVLEPRLIRARLERDLDEATHGASRVRTVLFPRALLGDRPAQVRARRVVDARRSERVTEEIERGATFLRLGDEVELGVLDHLGHLRDRLFVATDGDQGFGLGDALGELLDANGVGGAETTARHRVVVGAHAGAAGGVRRAETGRGRGARSGRDAGAGAGGVGVTAGAVGSRVARGPSGERSVNASASRAARARITCRPASRPPSRGRAGRTSRSCRPGSPCPCSSRRSPSPAPRRGDRAGRRR